jgi:hypothetical protein
VFLLGWLMMAAPVFAVIERRVERTFPVSEAPHLSLGSSFGAVNIREVPGAKEIKVVVIQTADVEDEEEMDRRLTTLALSMKQPDAKTVSIEATFTRSVTWSWKTWPPVTLIYEVEVPQRCDLKITTGEGQILIGAVHGKLELACDTGGIFTGEIDGSIVARSRSGPVSITACTGGIDVSTDSGQIAVGRAGGRTVLASRGGYIELQRASGEVVVRGNGSYAQVGFVSPIRHGADIVTSGGSITLQLETDAACLLDLRASIFGDVAVRGELPLVVTSGGLGKSRLKGKLNGGGVRIVAKAGGGNVRLRGIEPAVTEFGEAARKLESRSDGGL